MKTVRLILACLALAILFTCCEEEWPKGDARMGYVIEIADDGAGQCTYYFSSSPDNKTREKSMISSCGLYEIGEGIFIPQ